MYIIIDPCCHHLNDHSALVVQCGMCGMLFFFFRISILKNILYMPCFPSLVKFTSLFISIQLYLYSMYLWIILFIGSKTLTYCGKCLSSPWLRLLCYGHIRGLIITFEQYFHSLAFQWDIDHIIPCLNKTLADSFSMYSNWHLGHSIYWLIPMSYCFIHSHKLTNISQSGYRQQTGLEI